MKPDRLSAQEGTRAQPISELEGAGASICAARFACLLFVFTSRTGSRRSTSRCGFGVSCMRPLRCPPPRPGSFLLQGGRTPASEGGLYIMQDTPNSYLEVERRESFLGILGRGLGRRGDFAFVDLCRFDGSWPPFGLGRAPLTILQTCAWHDFVVRFGPCRVVAGAAFAEQVQIHCSGHIFRSLSVSQFRRLCFRDALRRCVHG